MRAGGEPPLVVRAGGKLPPVVRAGGKLPPVVRAALTARYKVPRAKPAQISQWPQ